MEASDEDRPDPGFVAVGIHSAHPDFVGSVAEPAGFYAELPFAPVLDGNRLPSAIVDAPLNFGSGDGCFAVNFSRAAVGRAFPIPVIGEGEIWIGHHVARRIILQTATPVRVTGTALGVDLIVVEGDAGKGEGATAAVAAAADSDASPCEIIAEEAVIGPDGDSASGVPKNPAIPPAVGAEIDDLNRRVHRGGEGGADLEYPECPVTAASVEDERTGLCRRTVEGVNAGTESSPSEIDVAEVFIRRHASEAYPGRDEIKPRLAGDGSGRDDGSIFNYRRRKAGDPGGGTRREADVAIADDSTDDAGACNGRAAEQGEVFSGKQDRGRTCRRCEEYRQRCRGDGA